jgi:hypothetical protein
MATLNSRSIPLPLGLTGKRTRKVRYNGKTDVNKPSFSFATIRAYAKVLFRRISILALPTLITAAVALLFVPTAWLNHNLRNKIRHESLAVASHLSSLQADLSQIEGLHAAKAYNLAVAQDADTIENLLLNSTQRALLSYQLFPDPKDSSQLIFDDFAVAYCGGVADTLARMGACQPPTEELVSQTMKHVFGSTVDGLELDPYGTTISSGAQHVIDALGTESARNGRVYINPASIAGYTFWQNYQYAGHDQSLVDCWYGQLGYWIAEDVLKTIENMNQQSDSVLTSPVKRLLGLYYEKPTNASTYQNTYGECQNSGYVGTFQPEILQSPPYYVLNASDVMRPSFTGRISDDKLDVVHFGLEVVVEADDVLAFMKELNRGKEHRFKGFTGNGPEHTFRHNQITILGSDIKPVIRNDPRHRYCRYGPQAVVHLELVCEYIFERDAYDEIKPTSVKNELTDVA